MSAMVETNTVTASWRKRRYEEDETEMDVKRPRPRNYYYRLASESSKASEEDTESVYSLQDRETDVVRDTSDTESKSDSGGEDKYEVHYEEYDVASLSGSDNGFSYSNSSTDSEGMILAAAAAICDSSLENWITDCEDSDSSSMDETSFGKATGFSTCIQCRFENDNPLYRYCEKCFQDRKRFYPPRPKRNKKSIKDKKEKDKYPPVKLESLQSFLKDLSQDSGIGSSQEWPVLAEIVVEKKKSEDVASSLEPVANNKEENSTIVREKQIQESNGGDSFSTGDTHIEVSRGRKRYLSESSLSDSDSKRSMPKVLKIELPITHNQTPLSQDTGGSEYSFMSSYSEKSNMADIEKGSESVELCILCNDAPKDAIFLHSKVAHQCCCYRCAKRTIKTIKRCPICNVVVNKVCRVIKS